MDEPIQDCSKNWKMFDFVSLRIILPAQPNRGAIWGSQSCLLREREGGEGTCPAETRVQTRHGSRQEGGLA